MAPSVLYCPSFLSKLLRRTAQIVFPFDAAFLQKMVLSNPGSGVDGVAGLPNYPRYAGPPWIDVEAFKDKRIRTVQMFGLDHCVRHAFERVFPEHPNKMERSLEFGFEVDGFSSVASLRVDNATVSATDCYLLHRVKPPCWFSRDLGRVVGNRPICCWDVWVGPMAMIAPNSLTMTSVTAINPPRGRVRVTSACVWLGACSGSKGSWKLERVPASSQGREPTVLSSTTVLHKVEFSWN